VSATRTKKQTSFTVKEVKIIEKGIVRATCTPFLVMRDPIALVLGREAALARSFPPCTLSCALLCSAALERTPTTITIFKMFKIEEEKKRKEKEKQPATDAELCMHVLCWTLSWVHFLNAHSIPSFLLLRIDWLCVVVVVVVVVAAAVGLLIVVGLRGMGGLPIFIPPPSSFFWFCLARVSFFLSARLTYTYRGLLVALLLMMDIWGVQGLHGSG